MLWFYLILAHFIADFPLQGEFLATNKGKHFYWLFAHCMIWAGTCSLPLILFGQFTVGKYLILLLGHIVIDKWKCQMGSDMKWLYADQFLHGVQLLIVSLL